MWHVLAGHECIIPVHLCPIHKISGLSQEHLTGLTSYRNSETTVAAPYLRFFDFANSQTEEAFGHMTCETGSTSTHKAFSCRTNLPGLMCALAPSSYDAIMGDNILLDQRTRKKSISEDVLVLPMKRRGQRTRQFTERQGTCSRSQVQTQVFGYRSLSVANDSAMQWI